MTAVGILHSPVSSSLKSLPPTTCASAATDTNPPICPPICYKSSFPLPEDNEEEGYHPQYNNAFDDASFTDDISAAAAAAAQQQHHHTGSCGGSCLNNNTSSTISDYTSNTSKASTPSLWAVFDAWGAGEVIYDKDDPLSPQEESLLSPKMERIPTTVAKMENLPPESEILSSYNKLLKHKSSVHFGYPYNLMYNHSELYKFMKYLINNLGDPYVPSNYGVHS